MFKGSAERLGFCAGCVSLVVHRSAIMIPRPCLLLALLGTEMTTPGMIAERSYTCSFTNRCGKNETLSDCHCYHQQGAKDYQMQRIIYHLFFHLLKDLDFWDILDINLQNGHCLEGPPAFCQC